MSLPTPSAAQTNRVQTRPRAYDPGQPDPGEHCLNDFSCYFINMLLNSCCYILFFILLLLLPNRTTTYLLLRAACCCKILYSVSSYLQKLPNLSFSYYLRILFLESLLLLLRWNLAKPWLLRSRPETVISDPEVVATFIQPTCDFPPPGRRNFKIIHDSTKLYTNHHVNKKTKFMAVIKNKNIKLFSHQVFPRPKKNCTINRTT